MSKHQVNEIEEATPGAGVTITGLKAPGFKAPQSAFTTTAERDAFFAGLLGGNELAFNNQTGFVERYNAPTAEWRPEGVTGTAGPVIRSRAKGAKGDDANTAVDRIAILEADAAAALSGGFVEHDPGIYRITASMVLAGRHHFNGAKLKPAAGAAIQVDGLFEAPPIPILDFSLGGTINFTKQSKFKAEWFNLPADGTDASTALNRMFAGVPDYAKIVQPGRVTYSIGGLVMLPNKKGVEITSEIDARIPDAGAPMWQWIGPVHGTLLYVDRCKNCKIDGIVFDAGSPALGHVGADVLIDCDGYSVGNIGTQCTFTHNVFSFQQDNPASYGIRLAFSGVPNQEYHRIAQNAFQGSNSYIGIDMATTVAGSAIVNTDNPIFNPVDGSFANVDGKPIAIAGAGVGGAALYTTVVNTISASQVQIAVAATVGGHFPILAGTRYGRAITIGPNANTKGIIIEDNNINQFERGIWQQYGSHRGNRNSFFYNNVNIWLDGMADPCSEWQTQSEWSMQHVINFAPQPWACYGGRIDVENLMPGAAAFTSSLNSGKIRIVSTVMENQIRAGSGSTFTNAKRAADVEGRGGLFTLEDIHQGVGATLADLGGDEYTPWTLIHVSYSPGGVDFHDTAYQYSDTQFFGGGIRASYVNNYANKRGRAAVNAIIQKLTGDDDAVAIRAAGGKNGNGGAINELVGFLWDQDTECTHVGKMIGFKSRARAAAFANPLYWAHYQAETPVWLAGGGLAGDWVSFHSLPQRLAAMAIGKVFGFKQDGVNDINRFEGRSYFAAPNSVPDDAIIPPGGYSAYLNEAGNQFTVRVKYTDGVTMKTGTVALV